ncbi:xanthine dehydrogenase accessory protein XdhC [Nocardia africana]|uniref:Xanthine dehydrogenase accessory protein XdhC n=2 Tax=Nocardia africana TaxID=134964 RepID=A0A378WT22_9NOCA|nr:xanthine dehydrogenase accessory protein XdhC [Nocardia africana]
MIVAPDGSVAGSVSGGCVDAAVYELATEVVRIGRPRLQSYGVDTDELFGIGLTCGGEIDVFAEPISRQTFRHLPRVRADIAADRPTAIATVVAASEGARLGRRLIVTPDSIHGSLGSGRADAAVAACARELLAADRAGVINCGPDGHPFEAGMDVFVNTFAPRPRMLIFGAIDFAAALAQQGALLGYRVTVCDARPRFATVDRFPAADEVVVDRPDRYLTAQAQRNTLDGRTVVCVLTHDPKFDVPLLRVALRLPAFGYVGAMGSRRTHDDRLRRLRAAGLTDAELRRLAGPVGLDLGARTPQETAVSIVAEIIMRTRGGAGHPLTELAGPIHHDHTP